MRGIGGYNFEGDKQGNGGGAFIKKKEGNRSPLEVFDKLPFSGSPDVFPRSADPLRSLAGKDVG
jgi:hypothetical protein